MNRSTLASSVAACLCLGLACPVLAAQPQDAVAAPAITAAPSAASAAQSPTPGAVKQPSSDAASASAAMPAEKCRDDLRAFNSEMEKTGYWMGGSGYGYGYPVGGFGGRPIGPAPIGAEAGYQDARPGYEIRTLLASADILAQHGQQQACEDVLSTTRSMYKTYAADMRTEGVRTADVPNWRQQEIGAARPVTGQDTSFRSDELLGTAVVNPQGQALGSVNDIVTSRQTGQIAYLVIGRGGVFGIGESYVPVPWTAFKITPSASLLVLDTTAAAMTSAPQVKENEFKGAGSFSQESQKVDAYWKAQFSNIPGNLSKG